LEEAQIAYDSAAENIASNYYDSAEVVHSLFNSSEHRKVVLKEEYTHIGVGTFGRYYTQNFLKRQSNYEENQ